MSHGSHSFLSTCPTCSFCNLRRNLNLYDVSLPTQFVTNVKRLSLIRGAIESYERTNGVSADGKGSFQRLTVSSVWIDFHVALRERVELTHPHALTSCRAFKVLVF